MERAAAGVGDVPSAEGGVDFSAGFEREVEFAQACEACGAEPALGGFGLELMGDRKRLERLPSGEDGMGGCSGFGASAGEDTGEGETECAPEELG